MEPLGTGQVEKMTLELHDELKTAYRAPRKGPFCWPADVQAGDGWYDAGDWDQDELDFYNDLGL